MRVKQAERREREQKEELEREIQRRKQGQELQKVRQKLQDDEMKKLAELRRREKMEEKLARYNRFLPTLTFHYKSPVLLNTTTHSYTPSYCFFYTHNWVDCLYSHQATG